jgi:ribosomal-protein-alanine N-acetyltransferase
MRTESTTFILPSDYTCHGTTARDYLPYLIRLVRATDAHGVHAVEKSCFHDPYPSRFLDALIKTEGNRFFVAVENEKVIGYTVAAASGIDGHLVSVAVDPRCRLKGIGTALLSAVMRGLVEEGVEEIHLEVRKGNRAAMSFYERIGFRVSSEISHYYSDGEDAWVLRRRMEPPPRTALAEGELR